MLQESPEENKTTPPGETVKLAKILDEEDDSFCLEYPTSKGATTVMRLEASTYERALREARAYLGIGEDNRDEAGALWQMELFRGACVASGFLSSSQSGCAYGGIGRHATLRW